jgi:hypothetical protein
LLVVQKYEWQPERNASYFLSPYMFYMNNHHITEDFKYSWVISYQSQPFQLTDGSTTVDSKMAAINVCLKQVHTYTHTHTHIHTYHGSISVSQRQ